MPHCRSYCNILINFIYASPVARITASSSSSSSSAASAAASWRHCNHLYWPSPGGRVAMIKWSYRAHSYSCRRRFQSFPGASDRPHDKPPQWQNPVIQTVFSSLCIKHWSTIRLQLARIIPRSSCFVVLVYHFQFFNVTCYVLFGLQMFFLLFLDPYSMAKLATLVDGSLKTCPMKRFSLVTRSVSNCNVSPLFRRAATVKIGLKNFKKGQSKVRLE